jgi:hypothetical protein
LIHVAAATWWSHQQPHQSRDEGPRILVGQNTPYRG